MGTIIMNNRIIIPTLGRREAMAGMGRHLKPLPAGFTDWEIRWGRDPVG